MDNRISYNMLVFATSEKVSLMGSDLPEESHIPLDPVWVVLLDFRVKRLNDIIHHLTSDFITSIAGTLAPRELVSLLEDLKGSKPSQEEQEKQLV